MPRKFAKLPNLVPPKFLAIRNMFDECRTTSLGLLWYGGGEAVAWLADWELGELSRMHLTESRAILSVKLQEL